ncbi:PAS domain S-box protein [Methylobrevis pamukkalensis]|uniref:histidine kinase n=1 Tax=Methylobrevis pamukkalensis TaxID=1439726 RepID=A0A1E3H0C4_9HYPH|nr:PAS domain S-box protein [Methylobrevis pamukkalensis]ODN69767.1 Phytochrome-like protein cph1 [Methylobrevis pamukkalensis]
MSLSSRLSLAMILLVLTMAGVVGLISDIALRAEIRPRVVKRVEISLRYAATRVEAMASAARGDVLAMAAHAVDHMAHDRLGDIQSARSTLTADFVANISNKPGYVDYRLVGAGGEMPELVHVTRRLEGGAIRAVPDDERAFHGDDTFVRAALALAPGDVGVELLRSDGEPPVLRLATPAPDEVGAIFGVVMLDIELGGVLESARRSIGPGYRFLVADADGRLLVSSAEDASLALDFTASGRIQDIFPTIAIPDAGAEPASGMLEDRNGEGHVASVLSIRLAGVLPITVVELLDADSISALPATARWSSLVGGLLAAIAAAFLALVVARSLSRPLVRMTSAVEAMGRGERVAAPVEAAGEIGILARAFERMSADVSEKTAALGAEVGRHRETLARLAEHATRETLLASAVESSADAIMLEDLDGRILSCNRAAERFYGLTLADAAGRTSLDFIPEDRRDEAQMLRSQIAAGESVDQFETVRIDGEGRRRDVSITLSPVRAADGTLIGYSDIARDVTDRRAEEERFRLAIEACPSGMVMTDAIGTILLVNAETERLFGYDRDDLVGRPVDILLPHAVRGIHVGLRAEFAAGPSRRAMGAGRDLFALRKDGRSFPVEVGLNPIETRDGLRILAVVIDITSRKEAEAKIAAFTEDLKRSNAELEQFAYIAAHDLQEPLRMVASYTELLGTRYSGQLDERADKYIAYAVDGSKRMKRLINDLLLYSRVGTQGRALEPVDSRRVVDNLLRLMKVATAEAGAEIVVGDLPKVMADEMQLGQVFQNLLGNALKFRSAAPPRIVISAERSGDTWTFSVADNGIGMDPKYSERIFQMFQRLHERGRYDGSGIGLAIARKIIERHGGRIWFQSVPGEGSVFQFTLVAAGET